MYGKWLTADIPQCLMQSLQLCLMVSTTRLVHNARLIAFACMTLYKFMLKMFMYASYLLNFNTVAQWFNRWSNSYMVRYWTQVHWLIGFFVIAWSSASSTQSNEPVPATFWRKPSHLYTYSWVNAGLCTAMSCTAFLCSFVQSLNVRRSHVEPSSIVFIANNINV